MNRRCYRQKTERLQEAKRGGFTLMEMLTVLTVIVLLMGLSGGAVYVLNSTGLNTSTRNFAAFVNFCRSEAIARHTAVRVGIVVPRGNGVIRDYSAWEWNRKRRQFEQMSEWTGLTSGLSFTRTLPVYVRGASYAAEDASSVRGDYILDLAENTCTTTGIDGQAVEVKFFQFTPSGRVEAPGAEMRNLSLVIQPVEATEGAQVFNWSQINLATLTGRYRIYRP